jgi:putative hemolysin
MRARLLSPLIALLEGAARRLRRAAGLDAGREPSVRPAQDFEQLLARTYEQGLLREEPAEMIRAVFGLSRTTAAEVMTPRTAVVAIAAETGVAEAAAFILEEGHSRYPVFDGSLDHVVGVVLARDVWRAQTQGLSELSEIMRPALFVPDTKTIEALLRQLRRERAHLAIVIDEFGGTAGIVTIEDLLEEIVGEIEDELDENPPELHRGPEGEIVMSGGMAIAVLNDEYDLSLPYEDYTTVGGFVLGRLGRVARVGDIVTIRGGTLRVLEMDARRVGRIALFLDDPAPAGPDSARPEPS